MKRKRNTLRTERTPHDPLPFRRGEEKAAAPVRSSEVTDERAPGFLSPIGGEDQGEGATALTTRLGALKLGATGSVTRRARSLRKKATWAEKLLWSRLRNRQFAGFKFRRQHPMGLYDLDFYCAEARLAVELDGREHGHPDRQTTDKERDAFLARLGIKVIRFWNHALRENFRAVLDTILRELSERTPHLDPLPFGRGEEKPATPVRSSEVDDERAPSFLSPIGGEDQGDGATRPSRPSREETPRRKSFLKFVGPNNQTPDP